MTDNNYTEIKNSPFSSSDLAVLCQQLAMFVKSGISLEVGMDSLAKETANTKIKKVLDNIVLDLSNGTSVDVALSNTKCFPKYMVNVVSLGYQTGTLEESFTSLCSYYERQASIQDTLKRAILYPSVLVIMMLVVLLFLSVKVIPVFGEVLKGLGANLSPLANGIMVGGRILSVVLIVVFVLIAIAAIIAYIKVKKAGSSSIRDMIYRIKLFEPLSLSNIASSMATTISSGVDVESSLEMSIPSAQNPHIREKAVAALRLIKEKNISFVDAFKEAGLYSGVSANLLSTGMQTGSIVDSLNYVAKTFEEEFENKLIKRISLIEPISVAVISVLIGLVLISVLFPLLGIMSVIGG